MEVHQHAHPDSDRERKKWPHYFWEFFMLFLAVTAGFFVENLREHSVERQREKQYIKTLVEDLKSDTSQLNSTIAFRRKKEAMVDSLAAILRSPEMNKSGSDIYYFARSLSRNMFFLPNDRTIQQLKNSGGMRLIQNISVSNNIMAYDQQLRYLVLQYETERGIVENFRETEKGIFDGQVLLGMIDNIDVYDIRRPENNPSLLKHDKATLNELVVEAQFVKSLLKINRRREQDLKETARQFITFLKKEYRME